MAETENPLITQLLALIRGGQAHATFEQAIKDFPPAHYGTVPQSLPYSAWQILEHMRITQRDILNFSSPPTGGYHGLEWPADYWPKSANPPTIANWGYTIDAIREDQQKFELLLLKPNVDLYRPFLWGEGQNLLRETLLIADHNSYHLGEFVVLRRVLGIWPSGERKVE
jgi:hypothetical protein